MNLRKTLLLGTLAAGLGYKFISKKKTSTTTPTSAPIGE
jgi:hypothetical protein